VTDTGDSFWAGIPLGNGVGLIGRDPNGLAALDKPAGLLSHPNEAGGDKRALLRAAYDFDEECYDWGRGRLWLLNRLDSATSGVILAAADPALAAEVRDQFRRREVSKAYRALVFGVPRVASEIWRDRLSVDRRGGRIRSSAGGQIPAECAMRLVRSGSGVSLVELEPMTGRSHQLRVQCARRTLPIVGDQTYGDFRRNREFAKLAGTKRMFLHSLSTRFSYAFGGRTWSFSAEAALPPEFERALGPL
jgi:23S rRNA-/tRNA-specific pseudouridylate synthase